MDMHFKPAWWLPGSHCQTIWPTLFRKKLPLKLKNERLELIDNDFIDIGWINYNERKIQKNTPIVVVLHGLTGSINSSYATGILKKIGQSLLRGVFMHFRGCSGDINRLPRSYHSGETSDFNYLIQYLRNKEPDTPLFAIGYSLGANVLLKWLGETGANNELTAAAAISVPFKLDIAVECMNKGFTKIYQKRFLKELIQFHQKKFKIIDPPCDFGDVRRYNTCRLFDNYVTAPLHGFKNADDYYQRSSCKQYLKEIGKPTLILHALNDPFTTLDCLPDQKDISKFVKLMYPKKGGHVGFVAGNIPFRPIYWSEEVILNFLQQYF